MPGIDKRIRTLAIFAGFPAMKPSRSQLTLALVAGCLLLSVTSPAMGSSRSSANYSIDGEQMNSGGFVSSSAGYSQSASMEPVIAGQTASADYDNEQGGQPQLNEPFVNLVVNGSFENTAATFVTNGDGVMSLPADSTVIPGWTTIGAELIWAFNSNSYGTATPHEAHFLDFTGFHDAAPYGGVSQAITTAIGQHYQLRFSLGTLQDNAQFRGPVSVRTTVDASSRDFAFDPAGVGNQWSDFVFDFTATTETTVISFVGTLTTGGYYIGFDNVSVVKHVPQPLIKVVGAVGNNVELEFDSVTSVNYSLQRRSHFESGDWENVPGSIPGTGGTLQLVVPNGIGSLRQFFRIKASPTAADPQ